MLLGLQFVILLVIGAVLVVRYRAFRRDLFGAVIVYPGLFAILVLLYLIAYAQVGTSYGIQNLFWSEWLSVRLVSATAATILLGLIGTIVYDLDPYPQRTARRIDRFRHGGRTTRSADGTIPYGIRLNEFLHVARWPFLILLGLPALLPDIFYRIPRVVPYQVAGWPTWNDWLRDWTTPTPANERMPVVLGYLFGLGVWIAGIVLGVLIFEGLLWITLKTHRVISGGVVESLCHASDRLRSHWIRHAFGWQLLVGTGLVALPVIAWDLGRLDWPWAALMVVVLGLWSFGGWLRRPGAAEGSMRLVFSSLSILVGVLLTLVPLIACWAGRLHRSGAAIIALLLGTWSFGGWFWGRLDRYIRDQLPEDAQRLEDWYQEVSARVRSWWVPAFLLVEKLAKPVSILGIVAIWWLGGIERSWAVGIVVLFLLWATGGLLLSQLDRVILRVLPWIDRPLGEPSREGVERGELARRVPGATAERPAGEGATRLLAGDPADELPPGAPALQDALVRAERKATLRNLVLCFFLFYVFSAATPFVYDRYYPSAAICLLLGVAAMAVSAVAYFRPGRVLVYLFVLAVYIGLVNNQAFKNRFEHMDEYYTSPVKLRDKVEFLYGSRDSPTGNLTLRDPDARRRAGKDVRLIDNEASLDAWRMSAGRAWSQDGRRRMKPKMVIISVSGGAARSAYWSACVVDKLAEILDRERRFPTFRSSVRIITGTSGGMLGMACYVERRYREKARQDIGKPRWVDEVPTDSLTPLARYIMLRDFPRTLFPRFLEWKGAGGWVEEHDRGTFLEEQWSYLKDRALQDYATWEERGEVPSLILSPMMIEDGRLLLITNLDLSARPPLERALIETAPPLGREEPSRAALPPAAGRTRTMVYSVGSEITEEDDGTTAGAYSLFGLEFFKLFPRAKRFRVATAVRMNATFPFVSPAVSLPTDPPRHVVDAGYYDNFGIQVSTAWIHMNREWLVRNTSGVLLVQIRDGLSVLDRWDIDDRDPTLRDSIAQGYQFLLSPIEGAAKARSTTGMFRNDRDVQHLSNWFTQATGSRAFFTTLVLENPAGVGILTPPRDSRTLPGHDLIQIVDTPRHLEDGIDAKLDERRRLTALAETKLGIQYQVENISMSWYLTTAERNAMERAFPDTREDAGAGEREQDADLRLEQKERLEELVAMLKNAPRDLALRDLVKIQNYARIIKLKRQWWDEDHSRTRR